MKSFTIKAPAMGTEQFVRYGATVGDFNPVHYDLNFAKQLKLPAVISQGPLTFTLALDAAIAENGLDAIAGFKARITAPVFPDTALTISGDADGKVTASNGDTTVLDGELTAR
jgi:acyl dehydratase